MISPHGVGVWKFLETNSQAFPQWCNQNREYKNNQLLAQLVDMDYPMESKNVLTYLV